MNLVIRANGMQMTEGLRDHTAERARHAFRRLRHRISWVRVQFTDLNGPRGGVDMRCKIEVMLRSGRSILVKETRETPFSALADAVDAARHSVARRVARYREKRPGRRQVRLNGELVEMA